MYADMVQRIGAAIRRYVIDRPGAKLQTLERSRMWHSIELVAPGFGSIIFTTTVHEFMLDFRKAGLKARFKRFWYNSAYDVRIVGRQSEPAHTVELHISTFENPEKALPQEDPTHPLDYILDSHPALLELIGLPNGWALTSGDISLH